MAISLFMLCSVVILLDIKYMLGACISLRYKIFFIFQFGYGTNGVLTDMMDIDVILIIIKWIGYYSNPAS